jgi:predicted PurR-regulated permease PerM
MPDKPSRPILHSPSPHSPSPHSTDLQTTNLEHPEVRKPRTRTLRSDIVFIFALGIGLAIAYHLREELALLYVSALFAVVLMPVLRGVQMIKIGKWHPGRGSAIAIILAGVGGAITLFIVFALPPVIRDMREFVKELPTRGPEVLSRLKHLPFASRLDVTALNSRIQDYASNFVTYLVTSVSSWASGIVKIVAGIVLTIYFLLEGEHAYYWILSFFEPVPRERLNQTLLRADARMGRWLLGQGTLMLILGVYSTVVFTLLHVRYSYALGVVMGVFNIIPVIGALVSMALVVIAAAMDSWTRVLYVLIAYGIYAQVENSYLTPKIMQSSVDLPGLAIIVSLLIGSAIDGVVGAMVSVPTAVLVAVILDEYAVKHE